MSTFRFIALSGHFYIDKLKNEKVIDFSTVRYLTGKFYFVEIIDCISFFTILYVPPLLMKGKEFQVGEYFLKFWFFGDFLTFWHFFFEFFYYFLPVWGRCDKHHIPYWRNCSRSLYQGRAPPINPFQVIFYIEREQLKMDNEKYYGCCT